MGYFSNGTEGCMYEERYCEKCMHYEECAVLIAHMLFNYDQHDNEQLKEALNVFIPMSDGFNDKCNMFIEKAEDKNEDQTDLDF